MEEWEGIDLAETKRLLGWVTEEEEEGERHERTTVYATWVDELPWLDAVYAE